MLYRSLRQSVDPDDESEKDEVPITRSSVTVTRTPVSVASRPVSTNDNPLGIKCLICKGKHFNLVQCKLLRNFIPYEGAVTKLPECVCLRCLSTTHSDGTRCTHVSLRPDWKQMICKVSDVHYIICRSCPEHKILQGYWRSRHDPAVDGLKGYDKIKQWFSDAVVHAGMHGSTPVRRCGRMSQA